jgi:hypothetical protein
MKYMLYKLGANLVSLLCISVAAYMAVESIKGWGWFLFIGLCCVSSVTYKSTK